MRLIGLICCMLCWGKIVAQQVSNVDFHQEQQKIIITYDIDRNADIWVFVSKDGGYSFGDFLQHVSGDVGHDVAAGQHKTIEWDAMAEYGPFTCDNLVIKIWAENVGLQSTTPISYSKKIGDYWESGLKSRDGRVIVPAGQGYYLPFITSSNPTVRPGELIPVRKNNKWGLIDSLGRVAVPCKYDYMERWIDGRLQVGYRGDDGSVIGYLDETGREIIPIKYALYQSAYGFSNGLTVINEYIDDDHYSLYVVNKSGEKICKLGETISYNRFGNIFNNGTVLIDGTTGNIISKRYDCISLEPGDGLYCVNLKGKIGYIDALSGKEVIPCQYEGDNMWSMVFYDGRAWVKQNGQYVLIDKTGKILCQLPASYSVASPGRYGHSEIHSAYGKFGIISDKGKIVVPCRYDFIQDWNGILANVERDNMEIIVNMQTGKEIYVNNKQFSYQSKYRYTIIKNRVTGLEGLGDENGTVILPCQYQSISNAHALWNESWNKEYFEDFFTVKDEAGHEAVYRAGLKGFITQFYPFSIWFNNFTDDIKYIEFGDEIWFYNVKTNKSFTRHTGKLGFGGFRDGKIAWRRGNSELIDSDGNLLYTLSNQYTEVGDYHEELCSVCRNDLWGYVDLTGNEVIPCTINCGRAYNFSNGRALLNKNGRYGFIDKSGKIVIPCIYDDAHDFQNGFAAVKREGRWGFVNVEGREVIPCIYDSVDTSNYDWSDGFMAAYAGQDGRRKIMLTRPE